MGRFNHYGFSVIGDSCFNRIFQAILCPGNVKRKAVEEM